MTDKDPREISAIKLHIPQATPVLCAFHVHKAMRAKIQKLQCTNEVKTRLQQLSYFLVTTNDEAAFMTNVSTISSLDRAYFDYLNRH